MGGRGGSGPAARRETAPADSGLTITLENGTIVLPQELSRLLALQEIARRLDSVVTTRAQAHRLVDGLDTNALKTVAQAVGMPDRSGSKKDLTERLVEFTVGNRINSAAIRAL